MSERRPNRGLARTDAQILAHDAAVWLLGQVAAGRVSVSPATRMDLRRLASDDLVLAGFGRGTVPTLLPRGARILAASRGEITLAPEP